MYLQLPNPRSGVSAPRLDRRLRRKGLSIYALTPDVFAPTDDEADEQDEIADDFAATLIVNDLETTVGHEDIANLAAIAQAHPDINHIAAFCSYLWDAPRLF